MIFFKIFNTVLVNGTSSTVCSGDNWSLSELFFVPPTLNLEKNSRKTTNKKSGLTQEDHT